MALSPLALRRHPSSRPPGAPALRWLGPIWIYQYTVGNPVGMDKRNKTVWGQTTFEQVQMFAKFLAQCCRPLFWIEHVNESPWILETMLNTSKKFKTITASAGYAEFKVDWTMDLSPYSLPCLSETWWQSVQQIAQSFTCSERLLLWSIFNNFHSSAYQPCSYVNVRKWPPLSAKSGALTFSWSRNPSKHLMLVIHTQPWALLFYSLRGMSPLMQTFLLWV